MSQDIPYTPPSYKLSAFNCPFCHAYANQNWEIPYKPYKGDLVYAISGGFWICQCNHCQEYSIWFQTQMIFPIKNTVPPPNADLPKEIITDYNEAGTILSNSPRGAAALLRLAIQKLCKHLGEEGENINKDIASLVKKGLPKQVQQSLDTVRVVGNAAVHPGNIDFKDSLEIANHLFGLVNVIANVMITQPKQTENLYNKIVPDEKQKEIEDRDSK